MKYITAVLFVGLALVVYLGSAKFNQIERRFLLDEVNNCHVMYSFDGTKKLNDKGNIIPDAWLTCNDALAYKLDAYPLEKVVLNKGTYSIGMDSFRSMVEKNYLIENHKDWWDSQTGKNCHGSFEECKKSN